MSQCAVRGRPAPPRPRPQWFAPVPLQVVTSSREPGAALACPVRGTALSIFHTRRLRNTMRLVSFTGGETHSGELKGHTTRVASWDLNRLQPAPSCHFYSVFVFKKIFFFKLYFLQVQSLFKGFPCVREQAEPSSVGKGMSLPFTAGRGLQERLRAPVSGFTRDCGMCPCPRHRPCTSSRLSRSS